MMRLISSWEKRSCNLGHLLVGVAMMMAFISTLNSNPHSCSCSQNKVKVQTTKSPDEKSGQLQFTQGIDIPALGRQPLLADIREDAGWSTIFDELDQAVQVEILDSRLDFENMHGTHVDE